MLRLFRLAVLFPALLFAVPLVGADRLLNPDKPGEDPKIRAKLLQGEFMTGKLTSIEGEGDDKTYILEVPQKARVINAKMQEKYNDLLKQYNAAVARRDANQAQALTTQLQDVTAKLYDIVDVPYEFSLKSDKDLVLRRTKLVPKEAGDDGKPVKYTEEELKALKGDDPKVPGYKAELKDLDKDVLVKVYIDKSKTKAPPVGKDKKKDETEEIITYHAKMMVILPPVENTALGGDPKDPKNVEVKEDPKFRAKLVTDPYIEGRLVKAEVDDAQGCILEVTEHRKTVNAEQAKKYNELFAKRQLVKNANELKAVDDQLKEVSAKYYDVKEVPYQFQLETTKELKVRLLKLPPKEPGKDGKPGKYTNDELKMLKGDDPKLPGYNAEAKDLGTDTVVRVFIDRTKFKPAPKPKPGEEPSDEIVIYPITMMMIVPPEDKPNGPGLLPGK